MTTEQLQKLANLCSKLECNVHIAWRESLPGGEQDTCMLSEKLFFENLAELNALVERFHMDNENEITSELI